MRRISTIAITYYFIIKIQLCPLQRLFGIIHLHKKCSFIQFCNWCPQPYIIPILHINLFNNSTAFIKGYLRPSGSFGNTGPRNLLIEYTLFEHHCINNNLLLHKSTFSSFSTGLLHTITSNTGKRPNKKWHKSLHTINLFKCKTFYFTKICLNRTTLYIVK